MSEYTSASLEDDLLVRLSDPKYALEVIRSLVQDVIRAYNERDEALERLNKRGV